jgi:hypothetical protein
MFAHKFAPGWIFAYLHGNWWQCFKINMLKADYYACTRVSFTDLLHLSYLMTSWLYVTKDNYGSSHIFFILCWFVRLEINLNGPDNTLPRKGIKQYITTHYMCVWCVWVYMLKAHFGLQALKPKNLYSDKHQLMSSLKYLILPFMKFTWNLDFFYWIF